MGSRQITILLQAMTLLGCGPNRYELYQRLPAEDKELFARTSQFMTDCQQEHFLLLGDSEARVQMVEELHVHDRLAKFPAYVQEAILAQRLVPGMTAEAVLLSWGRPQEIDRREVDGVPAECWFYQRGDRNGQMEEKKVYFLQGLVSEIVR